MIRRPPRSTPFPTRRSSDLRGPGQEQRHRAAVVVDGPLKIFVVLGRDGGGSTGRRIGRVERQELDADRKSTRLNSSHSQISYAVFCLKKKKSKQDSVSGADP